MAAPQDTTALAWEVRVDDAEPSFRRCGLERGTERDGNLEVLTRGLTYEQAEAIEGALDALVAVLDERTRALAELRERVGEAEGLLGELGAGGTPAGLVGAIHNLASRAEKAEAALADARAALTEIAEVDPCEWHFGGGWKCVEFVQGKARAALARGMGQTEEAPSKDADCGCDHWPCCHVYAKHRIASEARRGARPSTASSGAGGAGGDQ